MSSHRPPLRPPWRIWSLLTIAGPALVVFILGSLACTIEGVEEFEDDSSANQPGSPTVRVLEGESVLAGRLVYGDTLEVAIEHEPCDGELALNANGVRVEGWSRTYYGETSAKAVLDISDTLASDDPVSEVVFTARLSCYGAADALGESEPVEVVHTVAQVGSVTRNLIMDEGGLYSWDLDRFSSVTTRDGEVERVESAQSTLRNVVRAVRRGAEGRLLVEDTRGDLNVFTTEPLELAWSASNSSQRAIGSHVDVTGDTTRVWTVNEGYDKALSVAERAIADGEPLWEVSLDRDGELLAGPVLSEGGGSVRLAFGVELGDGNHELLEAIVRLDTQEAEWESLRISSEAPNPDVVSYTEDGAFLMLNATDNTDGAVLVALSRGERRSWQLPVESPAIGWGRLDQDTFWVATSLQFILVDEEGNEAANESLGGIIERVLPDPSGSQGMVVVTSNAGNAEVRWLWLTADLNVLVDLPVTDSTHDFLWEPGRAPMVVMSGNVLAPAVEQDFALVRLPQALFDMSTFSVE